MANDKEYIKDALFDWWVWTVFLTFFPLIALLIIDIGDGVINLDRILGDGELILSSFLVAVPSLYKLYTFDSNSSFKKRLFSLLVLVTFMTLLAYVSIKSNDARHPVVVYITSGLCLLSSLLISRSCEKFLCSEVMPHD